MQLRRPQDIGAIIRHRRNELGLTQTALAERIGMSRRWVIETEGGKSTAEVGAVLRTLQALDLVLTAMPVSPVSGLPGTTSGSAPHANTDAKPAAPNSQSTSPAQQPPFDINSLVDDEEPDASPADPGTTGGP